MEKSKTVLYWEFKPWTTNLRYDFRPVIMTVTYNCFHPNL